LPTPDVALEWKPTRTATELGAPVINLLPFEGVTIALGPFTDARKDPALIGTWVSVLENPEFREALSR
jgi:hypothetical protein